MHCKLITTAMLPVWILSFLTRHSLLATAFSLRGVSKQRSKSYSVISSLPDLEHDVDSTLKHGVNGEINSKRHNFMTPYEILYPTVFDTAFNGYDRRIPLFSALELLKRALENLIETGNEDLKDGKYHRIEHVLSTNVDVLGWFDAQASNLQDGSWLFYLQNQQETFETAALGSLMTVETDQVWTPEIWDNLPHHSQLYGGARFDPETENVGEEWEDFGASAWTLPAVELRRSLGPQNETLTTLAVHVIPDRATATLEVLRRVDDAMSPLLPPTTIPPVISRNSNYGKIDGQELYEGGVGRALEQLDDPACALEKVVLARRQTIELGLPDFTARRVLQRWKYGGGEGGHVFYIRPQLSAREFFGCTPERLFCVTPDAVESEALAGTRPRGSTPKGDADLLRDLVDDPKDQRENRLTGAYIENAFDQLAGMGLIEWTRPREKSGNFFVRRLLHLQHICQLYSGTVTSPVGQLSQELFSRLHPTPAVCGVPLAESKELIRNFESIGFDRGWYAGPIGRLGPDCVEMLVAIRSGLVDVTDRQRSIVGYAGAGIVSGSRLQGEWAETNYKLGVISSCFPQSPIVLSALPTPNVAWATAFVEELIRNGVTMFYICPGSRSTPLVVALAKAVRSRFGIVRATSVHDERSAAFRALGYGRGTGRPAAVLTSSGTAVSNLYPAVVEAGMDGVPMILLTADRPYEARDSGANQSIDQVKHFSASYVRWFRDILPPSDDVPASVALADAGHAVTVAKEQRGPVHLNIQFRENLAPDTGSIRGDDRRGSEVSFNGARFVDSPKLKLWATSGNCFSRNFLCGAMSYEGVREIARLISESHRGIIVVGNLRVPMGGTDTQEGIVDTISEFANLIGFPVFAGAQNARMRFTSSAVVPFAEHILKSDLVKASIEPDFVLQIGSPLVSTEISSVIEAATRRSEQPASHVLLHPHQQAERADPARTVSHRINADIAPFLKAVLRFMQEDQLESSSELTSLVLLGRQLQCEMKNIILGSSHLNDAMLDDDLNLSEPEIVLAMAESDQSGRSFFISNSMPIRDCDFFLYPFQPIEEVLSRGPTSIGTNRGASGIDGIISSAMGFSEATKRPTTLLIGDMATLHDLTCLHSVSQDAARPLPPNLASQRNPLTCVVVNNDGGGIFSFLPIAKYGEEVSFDEFFGTPTNSFSFEKGAAAFNLPFETVSNYDTLMRSYKDATRSGNHCIIEARVLGREQNVAVHQEISKRVDHFIRNQLTGSTDGISSPNAIDSQPQLTVGKVEVGGDRTLVLLHGWMGEKSEWEDVESALQRKLPRWRIVSVDLPGHGNSPMIRSNTNRVVRAALRLSSFEGVDLKKLAAESLDVLREDYCVKRIDAIVGYSLGGRVALTMRDLDGGDDSPLVHPETKIVLLSASPGGQQSSLSAKKSRKIWETSVEQLDKSDRARISTDGKLSSQIASTCDKSVVRVNSDSERSLLWQPFLGNWYKNSIWGGLSRDRDNMRMLNKRRTASLSKRGRDLSEVLRGCTPPLNNQRASLHSTVFVSGELDYKYTRMGQELHKELGLKTYTIEGAGHAVLTEAPDRVIDIINEFLTEETTDPVLFTAPALSKVAPPERVTTLITEKKSNQTVITAPSPSRAGEKRQQPRSPVVQVTGLQFSPFCMALTNGQTRGLTGIGWGERARTSDNTKSRSGFVIEIADSQSNSAVGEASPLPGLHDESLDQVEQQLTELQHFMESTESTILGEANELLALDGQLTDALDTLAQKAGVGRLHPSVRFGLECAALNMASQVIDSPLNVALDRLAPNELRPLAEPSSLAINGLVTRGNWEEALRSGMLFQSMKVKVGYDDPKQDIATLSSVFGLFDLQDSRDNCTLRADANRAWSFEAAIDFALKLNELESFGMNGIEYVEEPLKKISRKKQSWSLEGHVNELENWHSQTGINYALDESLYDVVVASSFSFETVKRSMDKVFNRSNRGCSAFVLKPAVLGAELSCQLARLARDGYGIGAVFSSSFDSGIGLAYTAVLADFSDKIASRGKKYAHGIGTFQQFEADILAPSFMSYVSEPGFVNVASLSRAMYGLRLGELTITGHTTVPDEPDIVQGTKVNEYEASTSTNSAGNEINVIVSLPLPFSASVACSRFTDLPQQPRWSPWISSVECQDSRSRWTVNVRGISLTWQATSEVLNDPWPGIRWESVSGLRNGGVVEFVPETNETCQMNVKMSIIPPRVVQPLFRGTSGFLQDFMREKLLKWSLEMFRDVVKADLAVERGDVELGDALFGAVEGKASAIEATLKIPYSLPDEKST